MASVNVVLWERGKPILEQKPKKVSTVKKNGEDFAPSYIRQIDNVSGIEQWFKKVDLTFQGSYVYAQLDGNNGLHFH